MAGKWIRTQVKIVNTVSYGGSRDSPRDSPDGTEASEAAVERSPARGSGLDIRISDENAAGRLAGLAVGVFNATLGRGLGVLARSVTRPFVDGLEKNLTRTVAGSPGGGRMRDSLEGDPPAASGAISFAAVDDDSSSTED